MRKADDRFNDQFIIDEYGYDKVIKNKAFTYLFQARHDIWVNILKIPCHLTLD